MDGDDSEIVVGGDDDTKQTELLQDETTEDTTITTNNTETVQDNLTEPSSGLAPPLSQEDLTRAVSVTDISTEPSLEDIGTSLQNIDPFNDDQAELKFLLSKPTCFFITGKPGCGKTTLARKLAAQWRCPLINPTDVIEEGMAKETEMGLKCQEILLNGEAIPDTMVHKMMIDKINSPQVIHHGYVLDGFPCLNEEIMSCHDQLEQVKSLKLKPDIIINLRVPDSDLKSRRTNQKVDPVTNLIYIKEIYAPDVADKKSKDKGEGEGDEEEEEEEQEEEEEEDMDEEEEEDGQTIDTETVERLVHRPEDLDEMVDFDIRLYKSLILCPLEDYLADHNQQFLIELDANLPSNSLVKSLMSNLNVLPISPASEPIRLHSGEDEDIPEDIDTDELMRTLASVEMVGPRWKWRRSKWGRICPVALREGNVIMGKPEYAVVFLDKMYTLSSQEALSKFLDNPRPYLQPPQPRTPCKMAVVGPPTCGKTTLANLLAQKYKAVVLDMNVLIEPRITAAKEANIARAREEALEQAITTVKDRVKKAEEARFLEEVTSETPAEDTPADLETTDGEPDPDETADESDKLTESKDDDFTPALEVTDEASETPVPSESLAESTSIPVPDPTPRPETKEVDDTHPEVKEIVDAAVATADKSPIVLPPEDYVDVLEEAIHKTEKDLRLKDPEGPLAGGWIIDSFPQTRDQWTVFIDRNLTVDEVICLRDNSDNGSYLVKRWYVMNRDDIQTAIRTRLEEQAAIKRAAEEEERRKKEQEEEDARRAEEEAARQAGELESGQDTILETTEETPETEEPAAAESEPTEEAAEPGEEDDGGETTQEPTESETAPVPSEDAPVPEDETPPECPETDAYKHKRTEFDKEWPALSGVISGTSTLEPKNIIIDSKSKEAVFDETTRLIDASYTYKPWEYTGMDQDEEEEAMDADEEIEETAAEEEEELDEETIRNKKRPFGDCKHYCPVALKDKNVMWPGSSENAAKYRERTYYFSSTEARDSFLEIPHIYTADCEPLKAPPLRMIMIGPHGAGKSIHGRALAIKYGIFHISFRERLQELILKKTKKLVGPDAEDDEELEAEDLSDILQDAGITAPDGSAMMLTSDASKETLEETPEKDAVEEVEEEEPELTEDEEAIKSYLESDDPLPPETLDNIVLDWWNKEPFKSTGFIMEGFPRSTDEVSYMAQNGLFPDGMMFLNLEDSDVMDRLLPPRLKRWQIRRDRRVAKKARIKARKLKLREDTIQKRREELLSERAARQAERLAAKAENDSDVEDEGEEEEGEEEEEEDDIEATLADEFEEEVEEEEDEEEQETEATDRIKGEIGERYEDENGRGTAIQESLEELNIPRIQIDASRKPIVVRYLIEKKLKPLISIRAGIFEKVSPIGQMLAKRMLNTGYKQLSMFGKWCPVKLHEGDVIQPIQGPSFPSYPAVYRQHIYFFSTVDNREKFILNPLTYRQQPPPMPVVPIKMAVIGPPKSGKTTLANRFVSEYGMVRISIGEAMRNVISNQPKTELALQMQSYLKIGDSVPDELAVQALEVALMDVKCNTRGYILDGFPMTEKQVNLMSKRRIIPVKVIELAVDDRELITRAALDRLSPDRIFPMHDSQHIFAIKLTCYHKDVPAVRQCYQENHRNYREVNSEMSKWWVWNEALNEGRASVKQIQKYLQRISEGKAASIADMCITPDEFQARLGCFDQYCPVSLSDRGELCDCSTNPSLEFAAEFRGRYYKMHSEEDLEEFLDLAELYVPPMAPREIPPPDLLPVRRSSSEVKSMFPIQIELMGYCPVTYLDGDLRYESLIPGNPEYVVEYQKKLYYFVSEQCRDKFMRLPENYAHLQLPHKLPPKKALLQLTSLPMLGYMEQTVATAIIKSMSAVGNAKPKFPFVSSTRSALLYVAYHLKAYNPKSSEYLRKKYKKKLMRFEDQCSLITYLGNTMTIKYREPTERPIDFDSKMSTFLALKESVPTLNWLA